MRNRPFVGIAMPIVFGLIGLSNVTSKPRFAAVHTVDVVQLIASGMCFGVALMAFFLFLRTRNSAADTPED